MTTDRIPAFTDIVSRASEPAASCQAGLAAMELLGQFVATAITPDEAARLRDRVAEQMAGMETLRAEVAALRDRPLFRLPAESRGFLAKLLSRKLLVTVFGVPIAWVASKLGVDTEIVIAGIVALAAFVLGQSAVDSAAAKAAGPHAPQVAKE